MNSRIFEKRIFKKQRKENSKIGLCHDLALMPLYNLKSSRPVNCKLLWRKPCPRTAYFLPIN